MNFQVQKQILEDLVHAKIIGFFTEWCNTEKVETCGFGYLDVTVIYKDDKDVKPGDLLFVQGRYTRGRERRQKGDIVHVEMFLSLIHI